MALGFGVIPEHYTCQPPAAQVNLNIAPLSTRKCIPQCNRAVHQKCTVVEFSIQMDHFNVFVSQFKRVRINIDNVRSLVNKRVVTSVVLYVTFTPYTKTTAAQSKTRDRLRSTVSTTCLCNMNNMKIIGI